MQIFLRLEQRRCHNVFMIIFMTVLELWVLVTQACCILIEALDGVSMMCKA